MGKTKIVAVNSQPLVSTKIFWSNNRMRLESHKGVNDQIKILCLTDELKSAAQDLYVDADEEIYYLSSDCVFFKCKNPREAQAFFEKTKVHFDTLSGLEFIPDGTVQPSLQNVVVTVPVIQFLPSFYNEFATDIVKTELLELEVENRFFLAAEEFVKTFEGFETTHVIRCYYEDGDEYGRQMTARELYARYLDFTKTLISTRDCSSSHIVTIRRNFVVSIDGQEVRLQKRPLRALLTLSLLHRRGFNVDAFMDRYQKNFKGDAAKHTGNILKSLKIHLPKLDWINLGAGDRRVLGVKFRTIAETDEIERELRRYSQSEK